MRRGVALLPVLFALTVLAAITQVGAMATREVQAATRNRNDARRARWAAWACFSAFRAALAEPSRSDGRERLARAVRGASAFGSSNGCTVALLDLGAVMGIVGADTALLTCTLGARGALEALRWRAHLLEPGLRAQDNLGLPTWLVPDAPNRFNRRTAPVALLRCAPEGSVSLTSPAYRLRVSGMAGLPPMVEWISVDLEVSGDRISLLGVGQG